ncbi:hypothetical protein HPB47_010881 [Ixodes persulcatus]|uniref:Uncharacterized protein n=1 Tax=Ixodes persulcatus TaxID=34615 RepID=A0AC60NXV9_IXOPE|nr:hypothetical protein HPB47_010881 [Ixodes persulcatus]
MPTGCSVLLCPNRSPNSPLVRAKNLLFHRLPREEPLRGEWCRRISREDPGQGELRVCSDHFDGDRDYRRLLGVLRDAGQSRKKVHLKPDAVPWLRLPPTAKRLSPAKDPTVPTSKSRRTANDEPVEMDCFEESTPRVYSYHCRHRPATRDTAIQAGPHKNPAQDNSVGTDPWLGKQSVGTQANSLAKILTTRCIQTEDSETPDSSSTTVGSNSTTTAAAFTSTTTTSAVPSQRPGPACAMNPVLSDSDEEEEEEEEDNDDDPLWEPPTKRGFVK